jgi:hypothetical protein
VFEVVESFVGMKVQDKSKLSFEIDGQRRASVLSVISDAGSEFNNTRNKIKYGGPLAGTLS